MEIAYSKCGDYYIPNLVLSQEEQQSIGKYGRMRKRYLQEQHPVIYSDLLLSEKLYPHLREIDEACEGRMELLILQMAKREGVTETFKAFDQMAWVGKMNSIHSRAEEIVLHDLVYTEEVEYAGS
ncbi:MAG: TnpV protein [Oscillospiraceae bacterium]|nr:TnpV protein [Oscillospiraceae bacterium]